LESRAEVAIEVSAGEAPEALVAARAELVWAPTIVEEGSKAW